MVHFQANIKLKNYNVEESQFVEVPVLCIHIQCRRTLCITDIFKTRVLCSFLDISILVFVWSLTKSDLM